jgi:uncharacterized membrane protein
VGRTLHLFARHALGVKRERVWTRLAGQLWFAAVVAAFVAITFLFAGAAHCKLETDSRLTPSKKGSVSSHQWALSILLSIRAFAVYAVLWLADPPYSYNFEKQL